MSADCRVWFGARVLPLTESLHGTQSGLLMAHLRAVPSCRQGASACLKGDMHAADSQAALHGAFSSSETQTSCRDNLQQLLVCICQLLGTPPKLAPVHAALPRQLSLGCLRPLLQQVALLAHLQQGLLSGLCSASSCPPHNSGAGHDVPQAGHTAWWPAWWQPATAPQAMASCLHAVKQWGLCSSAAQSCSPSPQVHNACPLGAHAPAAAPDWSPAWQPSACPPLRPLHGPPGDPPWTAAGAALRSPRGGAAPQRAPAAQIPADQQARRAWRRPGCKPTACLGTC